MLGHGGADPASMIRPDEAMAGVSEALVAHRLLPDLHRFDQALIIVGPFERVSPAASFSRDSLRLIDLMSEGLFGEGALRIPPACAGQICAVMIAS